MSFGAGQAPLGGIQLGLALRHHGLKRGLASLCIGGGEGTAMAIELA